MTTVFDHDFSYEYDAAGFGVFLSYNLNDSGRGRAICGRWNCPTMATKPALCRSPRSLETDDSSEFHIGLGYAINRRIRLVGLEYETDGEEWKTTISGHI